MSERAISCKMMLHILDMAMILTQNIEIECEPKREFKMYLNQNYFAAKRLYEYLEGSIIAKSNDWQLMNDIQDANDKLIQMLRVMTINVVAPETIDRFTQDYLNDSYGGFAKHSAEWQTESSTNAYN